MSLVSNKKRESSGNSKVLRDLASSMFGLDKNNNTEQDKKQQVIEGEKEQVMADKIINDDNKDILRDVLENGTLDDRREQERKQQELSRKRLTGVSEEPVENTKQNKKQVASTDETSTNDKVEEKQSKQEVKNDKAESDKVVETTVKNGVYTKHNDDDYTTTDIPHYTDEKPAEKSEDTLNIPENDTTDNTMQESEDTKQINMPDELVDTNLSTQLTDFIRQNFKFKLDAAFIDWFMHDLPVDNKPGSLATRKIIAINKLTSTNLSYLTAKNSNFRPDNGGFLTVYHKYIINNIEFLINAIQFYNGSETSTENSNWIDTDTDKYFTRLTMMSVQGNDYITKEHSDYANAIERLIRNINDKKIKIDYTSNFD